MRSIDKINDKKIHQGDEKFRIITSTKHITGNLKSCTPQSNQIYLCENTTLIGM